MLRTFLMAALAAATLAGCQRPPSLAVLNPVGDVRSFSDAELCAADRLAGGWNAEEVALERRLRLLDCPPDDFRALLAQAERGDAGAMNEVGSRYFLGRGARQDHAEACRWFQTAADMGHVNATASLAMCHEQEVGGKRGGLAEAARLYALAADENNAMAQNQLGDLLARGSGVPKDPVAALKWYSVAATGGAGPGAQAIRDKAARKRETLMRALSSEQVRTAQRQAAEWSAARRARQLAAAMPADAAPVIEIPDALRVTGPTAELSGRIASPSPVRVLTVDGAPVAVSNGAFNLSRTVPIGDSDVVLQAVDAAGRTGTARVRITRVPAADEPRFAPLDPFAVKGKPRPKALALVVGVEAYESAPAAEFAERDAKAFYDYAVSALGVPEGRVRLLTGEAARRLDVEKAVENWLLPRIEADSEVFVFFSGHGLASDDGRDLFLLPYDGDRQLLGKSALRRRELIAAIAGAKPKSLRLFLDTCYSGGTRTGETLVASARPILLVVKENTVHKGVIVHSAAANDQLSSSLAGAGHGLFSYFLMRGLQGEADGDGDRRITDKELNAYVGAHVPAQAAGLGRVQIPQLAGDGGGTVTSW